MELREYEAKDARALAQLFFHTIHKVNSKDYTKQQCDAWAGGQRDLAAWHSSFMGHHTVLAQLHGKVIGFGDMDESGHLDRLYTHSEHQGKGAATAVVHALEQAARLRGVRRFTLDASITARAFFVRRGYCVLRENTVLRRGIALTNFSMEKR